MPEPDRDAHSLAENAQADMAQPMPVWMVRFVVYPLAFGLALAMTWAFSYLAMRGLMAAPFAGPAPNLDGPTRLVLWLAPLAGLSVFQLIFGLIAERWRGWRFWAFAPWLTYLPLALAEWAAIALGIALLPAILGALVVVFLIGLAFLVLA